MHIELKLADTLIDIEKHLNENFLFVFKNK